MAPNDQYVHCVKEFVFQVLAASVLDNVKMPELTKKTCIIVLMNCTLLDNYYLGVTLE